ncbi:MAG: DMT family transporter [Alphaproteobacteria bacterium]
MAADNAINRTMGVAEWGVLVVLSAIWGGSFFLNAVALMELPPFTVVAARVGIAALALHVLVRALGLALPTDGRSWAMLLIMGAINNALPFSLILLGQTKIASGLAAILNASTPLWTMLIAHAFTRDERLTGNRLAGVAIGFAGVAVMIGPSLLGGLGSELLAELAVVGAALCYGCAGVFGRRFRGRPPLVVATGQVTASSLMLLPLAAAVDRPWLLPMPDVQSWAALAGLGLVCTALAYVLFFRLLASAGATNLALVTLLVPVFAILLGSLVLGEVLALRHAAGIGLIACGLAAIDGRPLAWLRRFRRSR